MKAVATGFVLLAVAAAGAGGYWAGRGWIAPAQMHSPAEAQPGPSEAADPVLYYRDPTGRPEYSAVPRTTGDGRAFLAVRPSEDIGFDPATGETVAPKTAAKTAAKTAGEAEAAPKAGSSRILYYRNPMGLPDTSPTPKKDSMGMDYIPVREDEGGDDGSVSVSAGKRQRSGVRTEKLGLRTLSAPLRASGSIQLDERRVSVVSVRSQSFVQKVEAVTTGELVRKGQALMQVYSPEVAAAAAQFLSVVGQPLNARAAVDGARRRLENLDVPASVIDAIAASGKVPATIAWPAPRDGLILSRSAVDGMQAMPGDEMFRLADVSIVWALLDVAERDLPMVAVGQTVSVRPRGSDKAITGKIALIYPGINRETRTARIRVELPNADRALLPDMYVEADIATGAGGPVLAAPTSAVIDSGDRQIVLVETGDGRFEPRPVKLGLRSEGFIELKEGVAEGETVVVGANFLIDAESNLKAALSGLTAPEQPASPEQPK